MITQKQLKNKLNSIKINFKRFKKLPSKLSHFDWNKNKISNILKDISKPDFDCFKLDKQNETAKHSSILNFSYIDGQLNDHASFKSFDVDSGSWLNSKRTSNE